MLYPQGEPGVGHRGPVGQAGPPGPKVTFGLHYLQLAQITCSLLCLFQIYHISSYDLSDRNIDPKNKNNCLHKLYPINRVSQAHQDLLELKASRVSVATLESQVPMGYEGLQATLGNRAERWETALLPALVFSLKVPVRMYFVQKVAHNVVTTHVSCLTQGDKGKRGKNGTPGQPGPTGSPGKPVDKTLS